ncbi:MAG: hypothetical protein RLZZ612_1402 [Pseudomonadota bacterium]|jgi:hypothetical protein
MQSLIAYEQPLQKIFSADYVFRIPDYQRPYSWTTEQAQELLDDVLGFIQSKPAGAVGEQPSYFLGSIVLIKQANAPQADVVDGQQRLTTLTLLLSVIRAQLDEKLRPLITKSIYEEGNIFNGTTDHFRLSLRQRDAAFFQRHVQRDGGLAELLALEVDLSDTERLLRDNARLFDARLSALEPAQRMALAQFILQRCFLVVVCTPDVHSAYRIFSVLNSRGLDLTATDLLKARIIGHIPEAERDAYTRKWEDTEEDLGRDDFNTLFSHIRTVYRKAKAQETLVKEFETHVPAILTPTTFIDDVLLPMAQAFGELSTASYAAPSHAEAINQHLRWLNRLEFKDWMPPALAFVTRYRQDPPKLLAFFADLERLAYFMLVTSQGVNDRIERFAKVTRDIENKVSLHQPLPNAASSHLQLSAEEQWQFYDRLDGPIYATLSAKARTPVLLRLDSLLSSGGVWHDVNIISVEHVLPQHPALGSQWLTWFPDPAERARWVHRLGNLALLTRRKNSQASNWEFERKKNTYFSRGGVSTFALTVQILSQPEWTPPLVAQRHAQLMALLAQHWRLDTSLDEFLKQSTATP